MRLEWILAVIVLIIVAFFWGGLAKQQELERTTIPEVGALARAQGYEDGFHQGLYVGEVRERLRLLHNVTQYPDPYCQIWLEDLGPLAVANCTAGVYEMSISGNYTTWFRETPNETPTE